MEPDPSYYSTVAQVIPTLLIAAVLESRFLLHWRARPTLADLRHHPGFYAAFGLLNTAAGLGAFVAVFALFTGEGDEYLFKALTLWGVTAALILVIFPILLGPWINVLADLPAGTRSPRVGKWLEWVFLALVIFLGWAVSLLIGSAGPSGGGI